LASGASIREDGKGSLVVLLLAERAR